MLSSTNARLASARRLTRRKDRRDTGRFLAEGPQAVREALCAGVVEDVYATAEAMARNGDLFGDVDAAEISPKDAAALSETVSPQGVIAVCRRADVTLEAAFRRTPALAAVLVDTSDPGNAGTVLRTADAAGAGAVVFAGGVDPYNGKAVRASAGSLFHVDVVVDVKVDDVLRTAARRGVTTLATTGQGAVALDSLLDDGSLASPTAWLFGNEAHGLPEPVLAAADLTVRVPIYGGAESLNLAAAAAVCLYASAWAQRRTR